MKIEQLKGEFAVCRLKQKAFPEGGFVSLTVCDDEISLVCEADKTPPDCVAEANWAALRIAGTLDFSLVGVLAGLTDILATAGVSVFAISTYNTDYLFIKIKNLECAKKALEAGGHTIIVL